MNWINKEYAEKMAKLADPKDKEAAHVEADALLCELLCTLGYDGVVKEFNKLEKWYG